MTHGFLGYAFPGGVNIAKKCVKDSIMMLQELLTKNDGVKVEGREGFPPQG